MIRLLRCRPARHLLVIVVALLALSPLMPAGSALAHPLGNFTVNRYARIEVYKDRVRLHYVLDLAEIPTFQALPGIDRDGLDGASDAELEAYARTAAKTQLTSFDLTIAGTAPALNVVETSARLADGQGGLQVLRLVFVYDAPVEGDGQQVNIAFTDRSYADRAGWKEIVVRPSEGADVAVSPDLLLDRSNALLSYPTETLKSAPDMKSATFDWRAGTGAEAPVVTGAEAETTERASGGFAGVFDELLKNERTGWFILLSLAVAFVFGAQHALGPGHGKTMVAAYLVGSRGTPRQAAILGATVTATHTSTVYLLGLITLVAAEVIAPETVYLWMGVVSGGLVIAFGAALFGTRLKSAVSRRSATDPGAHRHGLFGRTHSHRPDEEAHDHLTADGHIGHDHEGHAHEAPDAEAARVTSRSLLSLGVLGGLLPCPSAVVVMVAAISQGEVLLGMLLIVAFSLGLAGVLTAIGMSLVLGKKMGARQRRLFERPSVRTLVRVMPVVSAFIVMLVGVGITYQAWNQPGL